MTSLRRLVRSAHHRPPADASSQAHLKRIDDRLDKVENDLRILAFDVEAIQERERAELYPDAIPPEEG